MDETTRQVSTPASDGSAVGLQAFEEGSVPNDREKAWVETVQSGERKLRELDAESERRYGELLAARTNDGHDESRTESDRSTMVGQLRHVLQRNFRHRPCWGLTLSLR